MVLARDLVLPLEAPQLAQLAAQAQPELLLLAALLQDALAV